jgi:hypothetical protein
MPAVYSNERIMRWTPKSLVWNVEIMLSVRVLPFAIVSGMDALKNVPF